MARLRLEDGAVRQNSADITPEIIRELADSTDGEAVGSF